MVSLSSPRSPLSKTPKQVFFFNVINILTSFTHTITLLSNSTFFSFNVKFFFLILQDIKNARNKDYYFDYNTVEQVLIMCSIILSLVAIMFESNQFYTTDPVSGIQVLSTDPETRVYYTVILVMAAITLIGSMVYYFIVFLAEVVGHVSVSKIQNVV